jgi:hypothetical protein
MLYNINKKNEEKNTHTPSENDFEFNLLRSANIKICLFILVPVMCNVFPKRGNAIFEIE